MAVSECCQFVAVPAKFSALTMFCDPATEQKVTHPLHSDFGRTLRDHFVACYVLLEQWGNPPHVCVAGLLHAIYQRGDGLRAVDASEMRPVRVCTLACGLCPICQ